MDIESIKSKVGDAVNKAKTSAQAAVASGNEKFQAAGGVDGMKSKAASFLTEVKTNFKADEGAVGVRKFQSMFVNLWKSGMAGKVALIACSVVILMLVSPIIMGGGTSSVGGDSDSADRELSTPSDTLVVKKMYMRMPGDDAVVACRQMIGDAKDLVVVDFRKGIKWREGELEAKQREYDTWVAIAKTNVVMMQKHTAHQKMRGEYIRSGKYTDNQIDAMGLKAYSYDEFYKTMMADKKLMANFDPEQANEEEVKKWLVRGPKSEHHYPPQELRVMPKKLIQVSYKDDSKKEDELTPLCNVWVTDEDKVEILYFYEDGLDRLFNAADLTDTEFAQLLVKNYPDISNLEPDVKVKPVASGFYPNACGDVRDTTWLYKDPRGFEVKFFERACYDGAGEKVNLKKYKNSRDANLQIALGAYEYHKPQRYLRIAAIKAEDERKFD